LDQSSTTSPGSAATPASMDTTGNGGTNCTVEGNNSGTFYCGGSNNGNGGLSLNNKIGIGVGLGIGLPALLVSLYMCIKSHCRSSPNLAGSTAYADRRGY
jgi:hypothetical protein